MSKVSDVVASRVKSYLANTIDGITVNDVEKEAYMSRMGVEAGGNYEY